MIDREELDTSALVVYLKMQIALWAAELEDSVLANAGLFVNGCPLCGSRETCPVCNRCDDHHHTPLDSLDEEDMRELAVATFFTNFCRSSADDMTRAMIGIAHPEDLVAQYAEDCPTLDTIDEIGLDLDVWGEFFSDE